MTTTMIIIPQGATPPPFGVTPNFEHPEDVLSTFNFVACTVVIGLMAVFVAIRLVIRVFVTRTMDKDDYICVVAWVFSSVYCSTGIFMGLHGGGNHQWEITTANMVGFNKALYADTLTYGPTAWIVKVTLLSMFTKAFAPLNKVVIGIHIFMGIMLMYYLPVLIIKIFACLPIRALWTPDIPQKCLNRSVIFMTDTVMSATTDFFILILPIPLVWTLKIALKKKVRIYILIGAGGMATLASVVRLVLVFSPGSFEDVTVKFVRFNLLGVAEMGIGIMCACIPAINSFYGHWQSKKKPELPRHNLLPQYKLSRVQQRRRKGYGLSTDVYSKDTEEGRVVLMSQAQEDPTSTLRTCTCSYLNCVHVRPVVLWDAPWDGQTKPRVLGPGQEIGVAF